MGNKSGCAKRGIRCCVLALAGASLLAAQAGSGPGTPQAGSGSAAAQGGPDNLTLLLKFENPVAALLNVGFVNVINFPIGPFSRNQYTLLIQPLLPLRVSNYWELITVPFMPAFYLPDVRRPAGGTVMLQAGYRYLNVNYRGGVTQPVLDTYFSGVVLGMTFNLK
jgi:hypothetical protein